jgi:hypothetical protein
MFRRMQDSTFVAAALIYAAATVHAWRVLPGATALKAELILLFPGIFFALTLVACLVVPLLRGALSRHIWISFRTGFGQSVISVLAVVLVLGVAAWFIYADTAKAAHGGRLPQSAFAAYAAGVGVLLAQALLVRRIERDPMLRGRIQQPG